MGWVRRHKTRGAILALIALALQIALTFGHVHVRGWSEGAVAAGMHSVALAQNSSQAPAQNPDDDYCAICASIFLASSVFAASPPQMPLPPAYGRIEQILVVAEIVYGPRHFAFRSRAPPRA
jgi:hypothetical protein